MTKRLSASALSQLSPRLRPLAISVVGQFLLVGLLTVIGCIVAIHFDSAARFQREANESFERRWQLLRILSTMQDAETGERGYIITGRPEFLEPYASSLSAQADRRTHLKSLFGGIADAELMTRLFGSIDTELRLLDRTITATRDGRASQAAAIVESGEGKHDMDAVRSAVAELLDAETKRLRNRLSAELESSARSRGIAFSLLLMVAALSVFISVTASKFHSRTQALAVAEGRVEALAGEQKSRDQMERRRHFVEEALRESEERYRLLLDGVQDYAIFMMDRRGQIVSWNAGAERIKGYTADEIIGGNFSCFFSPEDIDRGRPQEILRITAESGRHQEQGMRVRKDGTRFMANITFTALRDSSGNLCGFSDFSHDLSERKEAEAKYRGLLEAAPDAMVVVNQSGEIVLLNLQAEKQFGYHRDELVGQKVKNIIPEGFAERLIADGLRSAEEALAQQIGSGIELTGRRKNGSEFPIEIMLSPLESAEGILVTAAVRDISVRKNAEAHLRGISERKKIERMQSEFVSTVSHELRTPLTSIGGSLGLIAGGAAGAVSQRAARLIEIANNNTQRLIRLVNDILDIEKLQSGRMVFQFAPVGINEIIGQAITANLAYAASFGIELRRVGEESNVVVKADADRLDQAITNLISNAVKFSPAGASVEISAERTAHGVRISIADHGQGIPETFRARIFERFAQADSSDMRQKGGSGLGLSIVREIAQRHGGSVSFDSEIDRGASFHLDFPVFREEDHEPLAAMDLRAGRILVCAPCVTVADPICATLQARGFAYAVVFTEEQALFEAANQAAQAAIIDLTFAENLSSFVHALRDGSRADHLPVVFLCEGPAAEQHSQVSLLPNVGWIIHPAELERLPEVIGNLLEVPQLKRAAILHVEDDPDVLEVVRQAFQDEFRVVAAPTLEIARRRLERDKFDLVILDLTLSDGLGTERIRYLVDAAGYPIPIIVFTAQDVTPEIAAQVATILTKSRDDLGRLVETVRSALAATQPQTRNTEEMKHEAA